jgi:hypothetical protein
MRKHLSLGELQGELEVAIGFDGIARTVREAKIVKPGSKNGFMVVQGKHIDHWKLSIGEDWIEFGGDVALKDRPGIGFRKLTRSDDSRTFRCGPIGSGTFVKETGYWLVSKEKYFDFEVYLLGVLSSRVFDWYARCLVDRHILPSLARSFPVPRFDKNSSLHLKVIEKTRHLFGEGSIPEYKFDGSSSVDAQSLAELDAIVALAYDLSKNDLRGVLETFHPTFDISMYLPSALAAFEENKK